VDELLEYYAQVKDRINHQRAEESWAGIDDVVGGRQQLWKECQQHEADYRSGTVWYSHYWAKQDPTGD
jgi:hypothetical protein